MGMEIDMNRDTDMSAEFDDSCFEEIKKSRIFKISDESFKILCQADRKNFDPTMGLENLISMYLALNGPIDFKKLDLERARARAKQLNLL